MVSKSGKPIRTEGYGVSNLELNVPAKPETIYQSGSVGKQFAATAVMMLVEAGKVGLEDPLTKYFPEAPSSWKQVTVREAEAKPDLIAHGVASLYLQNGTAP